MTLQEALILNAYELDRNQQFNSKFYDLKREAERVIQEAGDRLFDKLDR